MTPLPIDVDEDAQAKRLERARLRLLDTAADLRPLASPTELEERLSTALAELVDVIQELKLLLHIKRLDESSLEDELRTLDEGISGGWTPHAEPVDELVSRLKKQYDLA